jgi:starch synthase
MTIHVLFLAAEAEPFVKIGGLGDVAGALPYAIQHISESDPACDAVDIRMALPYHFAIKQKNLPLTHLGSLKVASLSGDVVCQVYCYDQASIPVYLLDGDPIDEKSPVYSADPIHDGYKFVFFSLAALKLAEFLDWPVDILQANDWHTAAAIYGLAAGKISSPQLKNTHTILSLHNLPYMGFGVQQAMTEYGLPPTTDTRLPEWARHVPLPLGLLHADQILAVSPYYAEEILTEEFGCGLMDFLKTRQNVLGGIINGLDTDQWNPESDPLIRQNFNINRLDERVKNKLALQKQFDLDLNPDLPLLTLVSRMEPQKGIDIALKGLNYCLDEPWQAIILGTGNPVVEDMARDLEKDHPNRVRSVIDFDSKLAHQLYAGGDIFMMPSRYEPCGLSQMIAMRYGCIPVARATGGLVNTVVHVSHTIQGATGFLFQDPYPSVFARTLKRALKYYHQPEAWQQLQENGMAIDFSWDASARKYIAAFKSLISQ